MLERLHPVQAFKTKNCFDLNIIYFIINISTTAGAVGKCSLLFRIDMPSVHQYMKIS